MHLLPVCHSSNVGEHPYENGVVLWYVCRQCAHVWVRGRAALRLST
jgi:hypothetical protein